MQVQLQFSLDFVTKIRATVSLRYKYDTGISVNRLESKKELIELQHFIHTILIDEECYVIQIFLNLASL